METVEERVARLERENAELKAENERLRRWVEELMRALEEAQRAGKRQAAAFSRQARKAIPPNPGGKRGLNMVAVVAARFRQSSTRPWKQNCRQAARTAGQLVETGIKNQYQTEIPKPRGADRASHSRGAVKALRTAGAGSPPAPNL